MCGGRAGGGRRPTRGRYSRADRTVDTGILRTAKSRQHTAPPARADALADIVLPDSEGDDVRLGDLWSERPAALVWLRHYG